MTARDTAERHAQDVVDANMPAVMADFFGNSLMKLMATKAMPPSPTTKWEILSENSDADSDAVTIHVRYTNDTEALELRTRWEQVAGDWKIVEAEKVDG